MRFRKWSRILSAAILAIGFLPVAAEAQTLPGWSVGISASGYQYKERVINDPHFVSQSGPFGGIDLGYIWKVDSWSLHLEGNAELGLLDYASSHTGTANGLWNAQGEARALIGDDLHVSPLWLTPFTGLGYRLLYEAGTGRTTSTGAVLYDRLSQYVYVPLGLSASISSGQWTFRPTVEYDLFLGGLQQSYIGGDITNHQSHGQGWRASVLAETTTPWGLIGFGPFIREWQIGQSQMTSIGNGLSWFEPKNRTLEAGLMVRVHF